MHKIHIDIIIWVFSSFGDCVYAKQACMCEMICKEKLRIIIMQCTGSFKEPYATELVPTPVCM